MTASLRSLADGLAVRLQICACAASRHSKQEGLYDLQEATFQGRQAEGERR